MKFTMSKHMSAFKKNGALGLQTSYIFFYKTYNRKDSQVSNVEWL